MDFELYTENYDPHSSKKLEDTEDRILAQKVEVPKTEMVSDIEDLFVRTGEKKDAVKPRSRDLQFFFLINPKAGKGKG